MARTKQQRGFTLIELMVVVAIGGVLAVIATYSVRKYLLSAKSSEAIHMLGLIKTAQESFRDETFTYRNTSANLQTLVPNNPITDTPADARGRLKRPWANDAGWAPLGIDSDSPLQFGYACVAGAAGDTVPTPQGVSNEFAWAPPATVNEVWYVCNAISDLDGDGTRATFLVSSFQNDIAIDREGE